MRLVGSRKTPEGGGNRTFPLPPVLLEPTSKILSLSPLSTPLEVGWLLEAKTNPTSVFSEPPLLKTGVNHHLAIRGTDVFLCQQLRSWGCRPAQADPPGYLIT